MPEPKESSTGGQTPSRRRKSVVGMVRRAKMQKTITVDVIRLEKHPRYHKYVRRRTTYHAHDEEGRAREGDQVRIEETRPLSKTKRWRLLEIVQPGRRAEAPAGEGPASGEVASS